MTKSHIDARVNDEETRVKWKAKADSDKRAKDKNYTEGLRCFWLKRKR